MTIKGADRFDAYGNGTPKSAREVLLMASVALDALSGVGDQAGPVGEVMGNLELMADRLADKEGSE